MTHRTPTIGATQALPDPDERVEAPTLGEPLRERLSLCDTADWMRNRAG